MKLLAIIILAIAAAIASPLIVIWALNTLFGLGIAYTFWTWLAALIFVAFFAANNK